MELIAATHNRHKIAEFERILASVGRTEDRIRTAESAGLTEDVVEDGRTFEENALLKAAYPALNGYIGLSDDSGLEVDTLGGLPGIYSARFSGEHGDDEANNRKLLSELAGVPRTKRGAHYVCVIALVWPKDARVALPEGTDASSLLPERLRGRVGPCAVFRGECYGEILTEYRGAGGFGYDPLFYDPAFGKTFAQLRAEEKNRVSHRGRALEKMTAFLRTLDN
ncbi:MAG: non-canonical purine NTP pyrophosphatase [Clostridia bacterium]|nr:non-canonical purine NTP pyrophosphatase [Clostridia bacterium]